MTSYWGPKNWVFLHSIASCYPKKPTLAQKLLYLRAINLVVKFMPCPICKKHFQKLLKNYPIFPNIISQKKLRDYFYMLHNKVNNRLNKPIFSKSKMKEKYSQPHHKTINEYIIYLKTRTWAGIINPNEFIEFITLLQIVYPCNKCRMRLCKYQRKDPISKYLNSREKTNKWLKKVFVVDENHIKLKFK
tara:strand:+ start:105 stop:671 length:567 start_codon:yes stop_codon:yes gene_type:complete